MASEQKCQTYADVITLKEIDLKIRKGEFVCIIGDVGSGKSSLLSAINGDMLYVSSKIIKQIPGTSGLKT